MEKTCVENIEKLGNHAKAIENLERYKQEDKETKNRIFSKIDDTNKEIGVLKVDMSTMKNSFDDFTKNISKNYDEFKNDMKSLFNSLFTKAFVVLIIVTVLSKLLDLLIK